MDEKRTNGNEPAARTAAGSGSVTESLRRGKDALAGAWSEAATEGSAELAALKEDLKRLEETVARLAARASDETARTMRDVSASLAGDLGDAACDLGRKGIDVAAAAADQARSLMSDLEQAARRNPLAALTGAFTIGIICGMRHRRRR